LVFRPPETPRCGFASRPPYQAVSVSEFFAMGGYGLYVWGAYGVTFALLIIEVTLLLKRKSETKT